MTKQHELVAVEPDLKVTAERAADTAQGVFVSGQVRLQGQTRRYNPLDENGETFAPEITELATTVDKELGTALKAFGDWLDVAVQKELTNGKTEADVVIGEQVVLPKMSAPALLNLEGKLARLRKLYEAIPTNDPTERWDYNPQEGVYTSEPKDSYRAKKITRGIELSPATKEHPAQVQAVNEDIRVGVWTTTKRSGMYTPTKKAEVLARIDALIRAVKSARQRANDAETVSVKVAERLFRYISSGE